MPANQIDPKSLLDPALMARLDALEVLSHRVFRGRQKGERRSRKKGVSMDFADYRDYVRGDDTRFIDWNIFARLERLFIKLFLEEEDLSFHLIVDTSRSMDFGTPTTKFEYARRLAAALAYIGLRNQDKVGVTAFGRRGNQVVRPARGMAQLPKVLRSLADLDIDEGTSLQESIRDFVVRDTQGGIVVLVSDFMDERGFEDALKQFFHRTYEVYIIHLLSPEERDPSEVGHLELVDSETGERQEITLNDALRKQYRKSLDAYCRSIRDWAVARNMSYMPAVTSEPVDRMLLNYLRRQGLLG
ncbi:MAG: DUF58 domain-containing protein [Candidatus Sumerlaeia bacterium]|nr:DUF58 domain-containing protein [Candidatus Sumerlaeia bacterium]